MQSRLFQYTVGKALRNAVYEATDARTGEPRLLLEWTPAPAERDAARQRLEQAAGEVDAEVFSADASLYLAVRTPADAARVLRQLQSRQLFPGDWLEPTAAPSPLLPPPPPAAAPVELAAPFRAVPAPHDSAAYRRGVELAAPFRTVPAPVMPAASTPGSQPPGKAVRKRSGHGCAFSVIGFAIFLVVALSEGFRAGVLAATVYAIAVYVFVVLAAGKKHR